MRKKILLVSILAFLVSGCAFFGGKHQKYFSRDDNLQVTLSVDRSPTVNGEAILTVEYLVHDVPSGTPRVMEVAGDVSLGDAFEVVSGEATWEIMATVDKVYKHTVRVKALQRGRHIVGALVSAPIDEARAYAGDSEINVTVR